MLYLAICAMVKHVYLYESVMGVTPKPMHLMRSFEISCDVAQHILDVANMLRTKKAVQP